MPEHHKLVGLFERQRPQQDGLDDCEERCIRTDSQRNGDNRAAAKAGSRRKSRSAWRTSWVNMDGLDDGTDRGVGVCGMNRWLSEASDSEAGWGVTENAGTTHQKRIPEKISPFLIFSCGFFIGCH